MNNTGKEVRTVEMWNSIKRKNIYSVDFKKRLVAETKEIGKSVAMVAWLNHLSASQLYKWIKKFGDEV